MPRQRFKDAIYEQFARIGKAVSAPKRLELLDLLSQAPRTVEALAGQAALSIANTSQHLQVLRAARLVETEKKGLHVEYRLAGEDVGDFFLALRTLGQGRLAEIEQVTREYLGERDGMETVAGAELLRRVKRGELIVLDVRPPEEYRAAHIAGAVSIPLGELKARCRELPRNREIVAYCRGPYCVFAIEAVELLRRKGFRARRMAEGVPEWRRGGGRVEAGNAGTTPRASRKER